MAREARAKRGAGEARRQAKRGVVAREARRGGEGSAAWWRGKRGAGASEARRGRERRAPRSRRSAARTAGGEGKCGTGAREARRGRVRVRAAKRGAARSGRSTTRARTAGGEGKRGAGAREARRGAMTPSTLFGPQVRWTSRATDGHFFKPDPNSRCGAAKFIGPSPTSAFPIPTRISLVPSAHPSGLPGHFHP